MTRSMAVGALMGALLAIFIAPRSADAQPAPVTAEQRQKAQALYEEAVKLHQELLFAKAAEKYRAALEQWDHPHTRFNLSKALGALGRSLEAYDNLVAILPDLGPEQAAGEAYRQKLLKSLAEVEVHCGEEGAQVTLDGAEWLSCPGQKSQVVLPGQHVVVATKPDYVTATEPINLVAGERGIVTLKLVSLGEGTLTKTRFAWWKPWTVVGASVVLGAVGAGLTWKASGDFAAFDEAWFNECGGLGCFDEERQALLDNLSAAETYRSLGQVGLALGGVALAAAVALLALNRPQAYLDESAGGADIKIQPLVSDSGAGISAGFSF